MMAPDDLGERRQVNHTPTIALSIAAILLLIVGALSYRDFVRTSLEKEFAEKEARMMQRQGYNGNVMPDQSAGQSAGQVIPGQLQPNLQSGAPVSLQQGAQNATVNAAPQATAGPQQPLAVTNVAYDAQGNPIAAAGQATLPLPNDPELNNIRASLDQAREQSRLTEQRYNQLAGNVEPRAGEAAPAPATETKITSELPDFLRNAVENPPGGNPEVEARLEKMRQQVSSAPSLGKVTSYDKDWGVVTFNAGTGQGVKVAQRFAVRRGGEILGWVKVDQVEADQSIAVLVTKNRESDTSVKPEVGDDLIDFELF